VVERTGLAKSTAYRLLLALEEEQLVESFEGRFRIGAALSRSATSDAEQVRLRARPFMERLAAELEETVDLAVLVGDQIMIVDQMRWARELTAGSTIGTMLPAWSTASGRALLAGSPEHVELSGALGDDAREELKRVRRSKIAVVEQGFHEGISGVATYAVADERSCFALGVPVPTVRFHERLPEIRRALLAARPEFERIVG
jgi:DNA-binding IclR family transcriptional regulator